MIAAQIVLWVGAVAFIHVLTTRPNASPFRDER